MTKYMYKVFYFNNLRDVKYIFAEEKTDAEMIRETLEQKGYTAHINKWTWKVEVEE